MEFTDTIQVPRGYTLTLASFTLTGYKEIFGGGVALYPGHNPKLLPAFKASGEGEEEVH